MAALEMELFPEDCFNETTLRREVELGESVVIYEGDELIGYLLAKRGSGLLDILRVGVKRSHQRRGLGTEMLLSVLDPGYTMLTVRRHNRLAIKLYFKLGFRIVGRTNGSWVMLHTLGLEG